MFSDCHVHLDQFSRREAGRVLREARQAGVETVINAGVDHRSSRESIAVANRHPETVLAGVGIHPWFVQEAAEEERRAVLELAAEGEVAVISEVGLDFQNNPDHRDTQLAFFRRAVAAAGRLDKPLVLHLQGSFEETMAILDDHPGTRGAVHCFCGTIDHARQLRARGFYPSLCNGVFTGPPEVDEAVLRRFPVEEMVLDTDTLPGTYEVRDVVDIAAVVGEHRGLSAARVGRITTRNLHDLLDGS